MAGHFYRRNPDVDLFVLDNDFQNVNNLLDNLCKNNSWKICKTFIRSGRPKIEVYIKKKERLSVIPVRKTENSVKFTFPEGIKEYPLEILTPVEGSTRSCSRGENRSPTIQRVQGSRQPNQTMEKEALGGVARHLL
jgi:hypothetical protein